MSSRSSRTPVLVALGALLLVLAVAPFVPRGGDDEGALTPSGSGPYVAGQATTAGYGRLTPGLRAEVDRVVGEGRRLGRQLERAPRGKAQAYAARQVATYVRCADLEGQRYCLGAGWTEDSQAQVQARTLAAIGTERGRHGRATGDLDARAALRRSDSLSIDQRARAERSELTLAARSVAKVWLLRHELEDVALPAGFLAEHPEARATATTATTATTTATTTAAAPAVPTATLSPYATTVPTTATPSPTTPTVPSTSGAPTTTPVPPPARPATYDEYPESAAVLDPAQVAEQERNYYCGPTAMQMIAWGWQGKYKSQDSWAKKLGTTSGGTSITSMVAVTDKRTGWDRPDFSGPYVALDIAHVSFDSWQLLVMDHTVNQRAPMILHVQLLKTFFPYLDHDGSGHFQVGRGYDKRGDKPDLVGYFEPWNQQRFHPDEPFIERVQWRQSYRTYRATLAHYQHNVGV
jgi:hypothetical protein